MRLYKLTSKKWALEAIRRQRIKISTLEDINDPFEFIGGTSPIRKIRIAWQKTIESIFETKGLICFSGSWRNPVLWSHYADGHKGVALGFDISDHIITKVEYLSDRLPLPDFENASEQKS